MSPLVKKLIDRIDQYQAEHDLSSKMMAEALHVDVQTLRNWRSGKAVPEANSIARVCQRIGTSVSELDHTASIESVVQDKVMTLEQIQEYLLDAHRVGNSQHVCLLFGYLLIHVLDAFQQAGFSACLALRANSIGATVHIEQYDAAKETMVPVQLFAFEASRGIVKFCTYYGSDKASMLYNVNRQTLQLATQSLRPGGEPLK